MSQNLVFQFVPLRAHSPIPCSLHWAFELPKALAFRILMNFLNYIKDVKTDRRLKKTLLSKTSSLPGKYVCSHQNKQIKTNNKQTKPRIATTQNIIPVLGCCILLCVFDVFVSSNQCLNCMMVFFYYITLILTGGS